MMHIINCENSELLLNLLEEDGYQVDYTLPNGVTMTNVNVLRVVYRNINEETAELLVPNDTIVMEKDNNPLYDELFAYLGSLLNVEDGLELTLTDNSEVEDVIKYELTDDSY